MDKLEIHVWTARKNAYVSGLSYHSIFSSRFPFLVDSARGVHSLRLLAYLLEADDIQVFVASLHLLWSARSICLPQVFY